MKKMMDSTTAIITTTDNRVLLQKRDHGYDGIKYLFGSSIYADY